MSICHEHNLAHAPNLGGRFGIRVTLARTDPFRNLVGSDWQKEHWFATTEERELALREMSQRYIYFRSGDQPSLKFEKIERRVA
jgi:hypothetical protein